ncbi:MAG TPA: SdiA-regulated domain-containing protein [Chitinophagaceae bacterium]|nr:SdiA-regulated domain-containing protein [Chitinophagaceae bacterium]
MKVIPFRPGFSNLVNNLLVVIFCQFIAGLVACSQKKAHYGSPPGYDFNKPYVYILPEILNEISGVTYYPKDSSVFAIQDEKGWLFKIHFKSPLEVERWKFSSGGDYEDVALVDSTFFVLKSKGVIEKFKFVSGDSLAIQSFKVPEETKNEFETLFYDSMLHQLILICKNCEDDKKKQVTSWAFDPDRNLFSAGFIIETSTIREQLGDGGKSRFKPSAAAIHPLTGELYIIASVNHALVILKKDHSLKSTYKINPSLFKQPEGLTFTPKGDLIISNESAERGTAADILFFKYNKPTKR